MAVEKEIVSLVGDRHDCSSDNLALNREKGLKDLGCQEAYLTVSGVPHTWVPRGRGMLLPSGVLKLLMSTLCQQTSRHRKSRVT